MRLAVVGIVHRQLQSQCRSLPLQMTLIPRVSLLPKSIDKRGNPFWRPVYDPAPNERPFQSLNPGTYPAVGDSFHAIRPFRDWIEHRARAAEPLAQSVRLQIDPRFLAPALAFVNWIANARDWPNVCL
jgi:hypothetical protein